MILLLPLDLTQKYRPILWSVLLLESLSARWCLFRLALSVFGIMPQFFADSPLLPSGSRWVPSRWRRILLVYSSSLLNSSTSSTVRKICHLMVLNHQILDLQVKARHFLRLAFLNLTGSAGAVKKTWCYRRLTGGTESTRWCFPSILCL